MARHGEQLVMVLEIALTEAMIAAMAKADKRVCVGSHHCYAFPDCLEDARQLCSPKGRCTVGWIVGQGGRESRETAG